MPMKWILPSSLALLSIVLGVVAFIQFGKVKHERNVANNLRSDIRYLESELDDCRMLLGDQADVNEQLQYELDECQAVLEDGEHTSRGLEWESSDLKNNNWQLEQRIDDLEDELEDCEDRLRDCN